MVLTHDTSLGLQAAAALANSAEEPDTLTSVAELDAFFERFRYAGRHERTRAELEEVRAIRPRLRALLTSDVDAAVTIVNAILEETRALPQLVRHDEWDWHLHATPMESSLATRIMVEAAMAMVDLIRAGEVSRLSVCADDRCESVVLDLSRNRSRRYCSSACGNRNAVAAYRARHSASE